MIVTTRKERTVVEEVNTVVCDRCGKPVKSPSWDGNPRFPVRVRDRYSGKYFFEVHSFVACNDCLEMLWRMFNCGGVTKKQMDNQRGIDR
jgi:hypothetical protein